MDYALVALVAAVLYVLFRASRRLLGLALAALERRRGALTSDDMIILGFRTLIPGMLFLPLVTWGLAFVDPLHLPGGLVLHLVLVSISIVLFSFAEDLFGAVSRYPAGRMRAGEHWRRTGPLLIAFWIAGFFLISPLFYTGVALCLALLHAYALSCRSQRAAPQTRR